MSQTAFQRLQSIRGTEDRLPDSQPWWRFVEQTAIDVAELFGYQRIDTPVIEPTGLFVRSVGDTTDIVEKEMYTFEDRGGDSVTLRPEGTAPVCRAYIEHGMQSWPHPVKLYYLISSFRYDRPQAGRYRQFHQFGYEALGVPTPDLDVEVIAMAMLFYERLGLGDLTLVLNSIGSGGSRRRYVDALRDYYRPLAGQLSPDSRERLERNPLRILDSKDERDQALAEGAPRFEAFLDTEDAGHFEAVRRGLDSLGIAYRVDHRLVRGLDYYTRTVFEIQPREAGGQSTLGGGGRYDPLMEQLGGPPTPGIGFATGLERIIANLRKQGVEPPGDTPQTVYLAALGEAARQRAAVLALELRRRGVRTLAGLGDRSMKAQLKHANQTGADLVVLLGDSELAAGEAPVRRMASGEQFVVALDRLTEILVEEVRR